MSWKKFFEQEKSKPYFQELVMRVAEDKTAYAIYPHRQNIFNAFKYCPLNKTKVVILGMDPYINPNEAHGLSFSVPVGIKIPPSLKNIFKELASDVGIEPPSHGYLMNWARQGVLLLNSILTVRHGASGSHKGYGWEIFTDNAIKLLNDQNNPIVFMLWGSFAKSKKELITNSRHLILQSVHPSPLSAHNGFFGNKHFSKCNQFLISNNIEPINWQV